MLLISTPLIFFTMLTGPPLGPHRGRREWRAPALRPEQVWQGGDSKVGRGPRARHAQHYLPWWTAWYASFYAQSSPPIANHKYTQADGFNPSFTSRTSPAAICKLVECKIEWPMCDVQLSGHVRDMQPGHTTRESRGSTTP